MRCDVSRDDQVVAAVAEILERLGRIDILVNNAGIWRRAPIIEMTAADIDETLRVNLAGVLLVTREAVKDMLTREWGRVINVSSTAGIRGEPFHSHYAATKGALFALSRSLAGELSPRGITVNTVSPGWVFTDMTSEALTPEKVHELEKTLPTGPPDPSGRRRERRALPRVPARVADHGGEHRRQRGSGVFLESRSKSSLPSDLLRCSYPVNNPSMTSLWSSSMIPRRFLRVAVSVPSSVENGRAR